MMKSRESELRKIDGVRIEGIGNEKNCETEIQQKAEESNK